jgi:hypothetical protein
MVQSSPTIFEKHIHLTLSEELLDLVSILLCIKQSVYFVKSSIWEKKIVKRNPITTADQVLLFEFSDVIHD